MLVAIVIVFLLIYTVSRSFTNKIHVPLVEKRSTINKVLFFLLVTSIVQIVLGTQVREAIDEIADALAGNNRNSWIEQLGIGFYVHRSLSSIILLAHIYLLYLLNKNGKGNQMIYACTISLVAVIILEIMAGVGMAYFAIPAYLQPIHLLLAVAAIGIQFVLILFINYEVVFGRRVAKAVNQAYSYR
jgi:cytochrome c oxidase assembly protein subunit 15